MVTNLFRTVLTVMLAVLLGTLLAPSLQAQTSFGSIEGVVTDPSGALIPDATVTIVNKNTNVSRSTTTDSLGFFVIHSLNPGPYSIRVEITGFSTQVVDEVTVEVDASIRQDFALQVGAVTETVEVQATAPLLQTSEATVGTVITNRDVVNIPLNGRNFVELINLAPGSNPRTRDQSGGSRVGSIAPRSPSVNGTRGQDNNYTIDGIENNEMFFNFYAMTPSVEAIQEFKVQSSTTSGETGRASGATINVAIKSGTNAYHGNVYEFLRNDVLDANTFFRNASNVEKNKFKWNQFGATFGGPIRKDKTFFFVAYEGFRLRDASSAIASVPTQAMLGGDMSVFLDTSASIGTDGLGRPIFEGEIYDPATTRTVAAGATDPTTGLPNNNATAVTVRDAFGFNLDGTPGATPNVIPTARINQAVAAYAPLWPTPNRPGLTDNFIQTAPSQERHDQVHVRVDHNISESTTFFSRFSHQFVDTQSPGGLPVESSLEGQRAYNAVASLTHIFSPTTVLDLKLGYNRNFLSSSSPIEGIDRPGFLSQTGILGLVDILPVQTVPGLDLGAFDSPGGGFNLRGPHNTYQGKATFRHTRGRHEFSAGFDIRKNHVQYFPDDGISGGFDFNELTTGEPGTALGGVAFASFLLGHPSQARRIVGDTKSDLFNWAQNYFLADTWRVTNKLTLNIALRYEYTKWPVDSTDRMSSLQLERTPSGVVGVLLHALENPFPSPNTGLNAPANTRRAIIDPDFNNFAPRIGIAYRLNPKTVIRAGYAIFYASTYNQQSADLKENFPLLFNQEDSFERIDFANFVTIQDTFGPASAAGFGGWPQNKRNRTSYSQQWNFTIEQQIMQDTTLSVAYVGQKGTKLIMYTDINDALPGPGTLESRRPIRQTVDGFIVGDVNAGENVGISNYAALQTKLTKRFSQGLQFLTSYTWSKSLDIQSSLFDNTQIQDQNCRKCDYGRSSWDQTHIFSTGFIYELPVGEGRKFRSNMGKAANAILGGWRTSGVVRFATGGPRNIRSGTDAANVGGFGHQRPNLIGDPEGPKTVEEWFNTSAFENATPLPDGTGRFGNFGRNVLSGPGEKSFDFSLAKLVDFTESKQLEFRAEFFNIFNHPNFGLPGNRRTRDDFGVISSTANDPRQIQFALKFIF